VVRLVISLVLIGCIVWWLGGLGQIAAIVSRISLGLAALVIIICMLDRAVMTFKWIGLLKGRGIPFPFLTAMKIYCASMIWGMFLPATLGADAVRAVSATRAGVDPHEVVASIIIERMIGFLCALLLGGFSLVLLFLSGQFEIRFAALWWGAITMILSAMIALLASFSDGVFHLVQDRFLRRFRGNRIVEKFRRFHETYREYRNNKRSLATFSVLTFAEQLLPIVQSWLIASALRIHLSILCFTVAIPLAILVSRVPISLGGLGTFEAAFAFLLSLAGVSAAEAVAIAFTGRILQTLAWLPWWLAHVISTGKLQPEAAKAYPEPATAELRTIL
jgi:glycosyltransferase 2 family protein